MRAGLVFSGGIAKGAYQIGVANAFRRLLPPDFFSSISASSIGGLNAYAYASKNVEMAIKLWSSIPQEFAKNGFRQSFYKNDCLNNIITTLISKEIPSDLNFYLTTISVPNCKINYVNLRNRRNDVIRDYLKASVSMFPFTKPILIDGIKHYDGAMVDNTPIYPFINKDLDLIIVVYFDNDNLIFESDEFNSKIIKISFPEKKILHDSFAFDSNSIQEMISEGENTAERIIKHFCITDLNIEKTRFIIQQTQESQTAKKRISGDIIVRKFNRISSKLIKANMVEKEIPISNGGIKIECI